MDARIAGWLIKLHHLKVTPHWKLATGVPVLFLVNLIHLGEVTWARSAKLVFLKMPVITQADIALLVIDSP